MSTLLTTAQKQQFIEDGYVVVSNLIEPNVAQRCHDAIWQAMDSCPDDPSTWPDNWREEPRIAVDAAHEASAPCRTPLLEQAAEELIGPHFRRGAMNSGYRAEVGLAPETRGFIPVMAYPQATNGAAPAFVPTPGWHLDGTALRVPSTSLLITLVYLTDTTFYGGATAVKPGSHRMIFQHCVRTGRDYPTFVPPDLPYRDPFPVFGKAGDVVFMHILLAHTGSENYDKHVRVALNGHIQIDPQHPYQPKVGVPQPYWTPFDYTLRTDQLPANKYAPSPHLPGSIIRRCPTLSR